MTNIKPALLLVFRDEADILEATLDHYKQLGFEKFYLCDNLSTDESPEIAKKYTDDLRWHPGTNWPGPKIINQLKNEALNKGYNWIFPVDADEQLCLPPDCKNIYEYIASLNVADDEYGVCELKYLNILPDGRASINEPQRKVFGKMRSTWQIEVGNHYVINQKPTIDGRGAYYKYYSIRSLEQFTNKMKNWMIAINQRGWSHPHNEHYHRWQREGDTYITNLYHQLTMP
jgi:glycosyltransferase involved in cell wall biosynthesis